MPKSKKRKKTGTTSNKPTKGTINCGGEASTGNQTKMIFIGLAVAAAIGGGWWIWSTSQADASFRDLAGQGEAALANVQTFSDHGQRHLNHGESYRYQSAFPTSGPHAPFPTQPGFYNRPQPAIQLVHAMEHGNIVIYYDTANTAAAAVLKDWAGLYQGTWDGIVAVPRGGLGEQVILSTWRKQLRLPKFDQGAAAAFVNSFRGRGPERKVR